MLLTLTRALRGWKKFATDARLTPSRRGDARTADSARSSSLNFSSRRPSASEADMKRRFLFATHVADPVQNLL
jgi:hypothetical protein